MTDPLRDALVKAREMARRELAHIKEDIEQINRISALTETHAYLSHCTYELGRAPPAPCAHSAVDYNVRLYGSLELATYGDRCRRCDKVVRFNN